ncbi:MAG: DNA primase [Candidatus Paceibacterota bacterium]
MSSTVEKIKEKLTIEEVVGSYVTLEKAGTYLKARCPFHQEKSPSFFVSPERNTYYCFGCGQKGDIFSFVEEVEALDFLGALKILADRAGVEIVKEDKREKSEREKLFEIMEDATSFFEKNLRNSKEALMYLKDRGVSIESLKQFRVGFAPEEWHSLIAELGKKWSESDLFTAGLIKKGPKGNYDAFRGRVMFPIFDASGRTVAFSGRILKKESEEAKYINSPETPIFEKSKTLYGINFAKNAIREKKCAVLVEGQMDLIMSLQAGVINTVATSGTSLTYDHLTYLKRITDTLVISFDSDQAGINASFRAALMGLEKSFIVLASVINGEKDPADIVKTDPKAWQKIVDEAPSVIDYFLSIAKKKISDGLNVEADTILKSQILPLARAIESSIDQSRVLNKVSQEFNLPENALREEMKKITIEQVSVQSSNSGKTGKNKSYLRKALSVLFILRELDKDKAEEFNKKILDLTGLVTLPEDDKEEIYFEGKMHYGAENLDYYQKEALFMLEDEILRDRLARSMDRLKKAEAVKDKEEESRLLQEFQEISSSLSKLSKKYEITR